MRKKIQPVDYYELFDLDVFDQYHNDSNHIEKKLNEYIHHMKETYTRNLATLSDQVLDAIVDMNNHTITKKTALFTEVQSLHDLESLFTTNQNIDSNKVSIFISKKKLELQHNYNQNIEYVNTLRKFIGEQIEQQEMVKNHKQHKKQQALIRISNLIGFNKKAETTLLLESSYESAIHKLRPLLSNIQEMSDEGGKFPVHYIPYFDEASFNLVQEDVYYEDINPVKYRLKQLEKQWLLIGIFLIRYEIRFSKFPSPQNELESCKDEYVKQKHANFKNNLRKG